MATTAGVNCLIKID